MASLARSVPELIRGVNKQRYELVVVSWAWNRLKPLCWEQLVPGTILDLAGMRPLCCHNDGEMVSGGVRVLCAAERAGGTEGSQSAQLCRESESRDGGLGEEVAFDAGWNELRRAR